MQSFRGLGFKALGAWGFRALGVSGLGTSFCRGSGWVPLRVRFRVL